MCFRVLAANRALPVNTSVHESRHIYVRVHVHLNP
jgi:hypothetical protein